MVGIIVLGMINHNIFTGSERGYLASELKKYISGHNTDYGDVLEINNTISNIDNMFHFAGPSDVHDFKDSINTVNTIITGTINTLTLAIKFGAKYIFASTQGVTQPDNLYCHSKLLVEDLIKSSYNNYIILRIPRVYSKCRKKGLMKQIRDNMIPDMDMNKQIEFITLRDFIDQTLPVLKQTNVTHEYTITNKKTIGEIAEWIKM